MRVCRWQRAAGDLLAAAAALQAQLLLLLRLLLLLLPGQGLLLLQPYELCLP